MACHFLGSTWSSPSMRDHSSATTWRGALASTSRSAKASSPMTALFYSQPVAGQCLSTGLLYIPLEPWRAHINVLNTHACTYVGIRSKQKQGDSATPPPHHRGGGGRSHMGPVYGTHLPHHRGGRGTVPHPTTPQGGEGEDLIWDQYMGPIHHTTGEGGGQCHTPTTPQGGEGEDLIWDQYMGPIPYGGGEGGVAGPGAYIYIYIYDRKRTWCLENRCNTATLAIWQSKENSWLICAAACYIN